MESSFGHQPRWLLKLQCRRHLPLIRTFIEQTCRQAIDLGENEIMQPRQQDLSTRNNRANCSMLLALQNLRTTSYCLIYYWQATEAINDHQPESQYILHQLLRRISSRGWSTSCYECSQHPYGVSTCLSIPNVLLWATQLSSGYRCTQCTGV